MVPGDRRAGADSYGQHGRSVLCVQRVLCDVRKHGCVHKRVLCDVHRRCYAYRRRKGGPLVADYIDMVPVPRSVLRVCYAVSVLTSGMLTSRWTMIWTQVRPAPSVFRKTIGFQKTKAPSPSNTIIYSSQEARPRRISCQTRASADRRRRSGLCAV
eukprot:1285673-Rhodomonas_salina.2